MSFSHSGDSRRSNDPFARMNRMMDQMFNSTGSFFGPSPFARSPLFADPFFSLPPTNQAPRRRHNTSRDDASESGTVVEELPSAGQAFSEGASYHQPLIEEPDDEEPHHHRQGASAHAAAGYDDDDEEVHISHGNSSRHGFHSQSFGPPGDFFDGILSNFGGGGFGSSGFGLGDFGHGFGGGGSSQFYSSSSAFSSAGDGTGGYSKSTTVRRGPNGAQEVEDRVTDGDTETTTRTRRIDGKVKTTTTTRDASGETTTTESLQGLTAREAETFDDLWAANSGRLMIESQQQQSDSGGGAWSSSWGGSRPGRRSNRRRIDII